jgi:two-component system osmolarity sensor histidine kinase EnvZ
MRRPPTPTDTADPPPAPLEVGGQKGVSLFWRTFLLLSVLLLGSIVGWLQAFRTLEFEPKTLQGVHQLASLVNLTRAGLVHADAIARVSLVKTLVDEENVRIAMREPSDTYQPYDQNDLARRTSQVLAARLGPDTLVAREVNGFKGLWVGFKIEQETYWLLTDPERFGVTDGTTWLVWLGMAALLSLAGAAAIAGLLNRPLKQLSYAASRVREGDFAASHLDENVATSEIRAVNIGFNRMAEQLSKADQDRAVMLAGISHDLRTPLARLRLETEMSVPDAQARGHMAADIEQVDAIINKFLDYARADHQQLEKVRLLEVVDAAVGSMGPKSPVKVKNQVGPDLFVLADPIELRRVFTNLLENAARYGKSANGVAEVDIAAKPNDSWVLVKLRDHGQGVEPSLLPRLTQPFFRGDPARTAANGSGLGLAIVERTIHRMGGRFALANSTSGGLAAHIKLQKA